MGRDDVYLFRKCHAQAHRRTTSKMQEVLSKAYIKIKKTQKKLRNNSIKKEKGGRRREK